MSEDKENVIRKLKTLSKEAQIAILLAAKEAKQEMREAERQRSESGKSEGPNDDFSQAD